MASKKACTTTAALEGPSRGAQRGSAYDRLMPVQMERGWRREAPCLWRPQRPHVARPGRKAAPARGAPRPACVDALKRVTVSRSRARLASYCVQLMEAGEA